MTQLIDYSYARIAAGTIKAAGYTGVLRYLSPTPGKNLSAAERDGLLAAGLSIGLVWESTATRAGQGFAAGVADAHSAELLARALGYPPTCPIFYAVDYDTTPAVVAPYFAGIKSAASWPIGVYGSANVVEGTTVPYKWQATAWSHGRISPQAHLYQRVGGTKISGTDVNDLLIDLPLWSTISVGSRGGVPVPVNISTPPATPAPPTIQEDDMFTDADRADLGTIKAFISVPGQPFGWPQAISDKLDALAKATANLSATFQVPGQPFTYPAATHNAVGEVLARISALQAALAAGPSADLATITAAAEAGAAQALANLHVTITG